MPIITTLATLTVRSPEVELDQCAEIFVELCKPDGLFEETRQLLERKLPQGWTVVVNEGD